VKVIQQRVTPGNTSDGSRSQGRLPNVAGKSGAGSDRSSTTSRSRRSIHHAVPGENPAIVRVTIKPLQDHARLFYIDRSCGPMMAGKALQVEKTPGEVERHIDRTHGVPAIQAAMAAITASSSSPISMSPCFLGDARHKPPSAVARQLHSDEAETALYQRRSATLFVGNRHGEGFRREVDRDQCGDIRSRKPIAKPRTRRPSAAPSKSV